MKLELSTRIANANVDWVFAQFNESLFRQLSPPFPPSKVARFDGCRSGDQVEVILFPGLFNIRWVSEICEEVHIAGVRHAFTDIGLQLPPFLKSWKHVHELVADGKDVIIHDRIQYEVRGMYPKFIIRNIMHRVFEYRQPIYQRALKSSNSILAESL